MKYKISTIFVISFFIFLRYILVGIIFDKFFSKSPHKIFSFKRKPNQKRTEISYSIMSSLIFGVIFFFSYEAWKKGMIRIDFDSNWLSSPINHIAIIILFLFFHDFYYYWLHRWMHRPGIYQIIHQVHHDSIVTSPWTSFSFHPLETILQTVPFLVFILFIEIHFISIIFLLSFMTITAVINHLNIELYPKWFLNSIPTKFLIGATHHALHHKEYRTNYGLYFNFWDKILNTESEEYN